MNQHDLSLLQSAPQYHLQAIVKARRLPVSVHGQVISKQPDLASMPVTEFAHYVFDQASCIDALSGLTALEKSILQELVACGGRANRRDLALYFRCLQVPFEDASEPDQTHASTALVSKEPLKTSPHQRLMTLQYPTPHPHGLFEHAVHRLLLLGLIFWGKQTNFVGRDYASGVYDGILIVPRAVSDIANEFWNTVEPGSTGDRALVEDSSTGLKHMGVSISEGITSLQRYLYRYWSLVAATREGLPIVNSRLLSRPALRLVVEQLKSPE